MINIKYDRCVMQIWENADLTDIGMSKFRKLLKLAKDSWENDPPQIYAEILDALERERVRVLGDLVQVRVLGDLVRYDNFYGCMLPQRSVSRLKKIEKMKCEVQKYV